MVQSLNYYYEIINSKNHPKMHKWCTSYNFQGDFSWCSARDLNPQPTGSKPGTLSNCASGANFYVHILMCSSNVQALKSKIFSYIIKLATKISIDEDYYSKKQCKSKEIEQNFIKVVFKVFAQFYKFVIIQMLYRFGRGV